VLTCWDFDACESLKIVQSMAGRNLTFG
jgi:hypothetical protein